MDKVRKRKRARPPKRFRPYRWLGLALLAFTLVYVAAHQAGNLDLAIARFVDNIVERLNYTSAVERESELIAFACTTDGRYSQVYTVNPDGTNLNLIQEQPDYHHGEISWSPDGNWLATIIRDYSRPNGSYGNDIYRMRFDGSGLRRMTYNQVKEFAYQWSDDGASIWFRDQAGLHQLLIDGHEVTAIPIYILEAFDMSSDGTRVAYVQHFWGSGVYNVYVMDADGSNEELLAKDSNPIKSIRWSPDNQHFAYWDSFLYLSLADADSMVKVHRILIDVSELAWSPKGRWIAFGGSENADGIYNLYILDSATGDRREILSDIGSLSGISWSPDGEWIAFSNRKSNYQLHKVTRHGEGLQRLTNLGCSAWDATWSPP